MPQEQLQTHIDRARKCLREVYGYAEFRPHQDEVIVHVMQGNSAVLVMPTGAGKSVCYQIPGLLRDGIGVVVSPLIALMQDQVDAMRQLGVRAYYQNSMQSAAEQNQVRELIQKGEVDLLYVAPERAVKPGFMQSLEGCDISLLAIDEAHCISQWGHEFRPDYRGLAMLRQAWPHVPCLAVTATADEPTRHDVAAQLGISRDDVFVTGFDRPNIQYTVLPKADARKQLMGFLASRRGEAGIVYCGTRKRVDSISQWLSDQGFEALPYHAGLNSETRARNQKRFLREDDVVMVATVAFGMGIDKPNVRFVAHLDLPKSLEAYYQESGRAGRDGEPAVAWLSYGLGDAVQIRQMIGEPSDEQTHRWTELRKLDQLIGYCESTGCRRNMLLGYFGESRDVGCGNCDTCLHPVETWDATVPAQMFLSCVRRTGERFGVGHIIDVLTGRETEKTQRYGHNQLPTWKVGEEYGSSDWRSISRQLVAMQLVGVEIAKYGSLRLNEASWEVLKGSRTVELKKETRKPTSKRSRAKAAAGIENPSDPQTALFERLRDLRASLAAEQNVPPYVVFHDRSLWDMVAQRPANLEDFAQVSGVGAKKLERYGEAFLQMLQDPE